MSTEEKQPLISSKGLPVPRLELRWEGQPLVAPDQGQLIVQNCRYLLVMPLGKWDIRREDENSQQVRDVLESELGCTKRKGGMAQLVWPDSQTIDTPYRAHSHIRWDSHVLNLPAYVTSGDCAMFLAPLAPVLEDPAMKVDK